MNLDSVDLSGLENIISSLSDEDIEGLKGMAQALFSENQQQEKPQGKNESSASFSDFDFDSLSKIASIMSLLSNEQNDPRCDLLKAIRPMVSEEKKSKVDQAMKMLRLMSILPKLKELG